MAKRIIPGDQMDMFVSAKNKASKGRRKKFEIMNLEQRLMLSGDDINPYPYGLAKEAAVETAPIGNNEVKTSTLKLNTSLSFGVSVLTSTEDAFGDLGSSYEYSFDPDEVEVEQIQYQGEGNAVIVPLKDNNGTLLLDPNYSNNGWYVYLPPETTSKATVTVTINAYKDLKIAVKTKTIFAFAENAEEGSADAILQRTELTQARFKNKAKVSETEGSWSDVVRLQHWFNYNGFRNALGKKLVENGIPDSNFGEAIEKFKRTWYSATVIIDSPRELSDVEANYRLSLNTPRWEDFSSSLQSGTGNDVIMPDTITETFGTSHLLDLLKKVKKTNTLSWEIGNISDTSLAAFNEIYTPDQWHDFPGNFATQMKSKDLGDGTKTLAEFFSINNDIIRAHFLGQASQETGGFELLYEGVHDWAAIKRLCDNPDNISSFIKRFCENGVYSGKDTTQWAKATWDSENNKYKYTPQTDAQMAQWWNNLSEEDRFNYIYSRRLGNGDIDTNEGYKYRGHGLKQLTFKDNYKAYKKWLKEKKVFDFSTEKGEAKDPVAHPDVVADDDQVNLLSALWYITNKNGYLNATKLGMTRNAVAKVAESLNGSSGNGFQKRYDETVEFYNNIISHYTDNQCKAVLDSVHQSGNAVEIRFAKSNSGDPEKDIKNDAGNIYKIISLYNNGAVGTALQLETVYMGTDILLDVVGNGTADNYKPFLGLESLNGNDYWSVHLVFGLRSNNLSVISNQNQNALKQVAERQGLKKVLKSTEQVVQKGFSGTLVNILNNRLPQEFKIGNRSISFQDLSAGKITSLFNCDSVIRNYLDLEGEFASYEGLSSAIKSYFEERISIDLDSLSQLIEVDVTFDEETNKLNFGINAEIISNHSIPFSLSQAGLDTTIDNTFSVNFTADIDFGLDLTNFLADPDSYLISDNDIYFQVNELSISGEANVSFSPDKSFMVGSIGFIAEVNRASFSPSSAWYLYKGNVENKYLTLADIKNGDFEWYNSASGPLVAELSLIAKGDDVKGKAILKYTDEDMFEDGNEDFSITGTLELPNGFSIGNDLINLGATKLTFDSTNKLVKIEAGSASVNVGGDILSVSFTDSTGTGGDEDTNAVSGDYNYETGDFSLDIDTWDLSIKGLLAANGNDVHFAWNDKDEEPGQEILYFGPMNAKLIPVNKDLDFTGYDDGGITKTLSIYDNGFKLYGLDVKLAENIDLGNGTLSIINPTVNLEMIEYHKGSAGLTGKIGISAATASVDFADKVEVIATDISGDYDLSQKKFTLTTDQTTLEIKDSNGNLRLEGSADTLQVDYFFGDSGQDSNEEVLFVGGDIDLKLYTDEDDPTKFKQVTVASQQMLVNGEYKNRSLSLTGNSFMLGDATIPLGSGDVDIGLLSINTPQLALKNFGYNRTTGEFTGKIGFSALGASLDTSSNSNLSVVISKTLGNAIDVYYDLNAGGFEGVIDRVDFIIEDGSGDEVFLAHAIGVAFSVKDGNTSIIMENVDAVIPEAPIPSLTIGKVTINNGDVVVTHQGKDYSMPDEIAALIGAMAKDVFNIGDDNVVLEQNDDQSFTLYRKDGDSLTEIWTKTYDDFTENKLVIDLDSTDEGYYGADGVDRILISSDINLTDSSDNTRHSLIIKSDYITVSNVEISGAEELDFDASSKLDISALQIIDLLVQAFRVDIDNGAVDIGINYDTLVNRLLGRSEAVISVVGSDISATKVNFEAVVDVNGTSKELFPIDFSGSDDDASKFKINGLTTALASVQAKALVNILNSVVTTQNDFTITSNAMVKITNEAIAKKQEDDDKNDEESTEYEAVVALAIVNSKSIAAVGGNSQLNISGKITINATNVTEVNNIANGIPEKEPEQTEEESGKAYGGSFGILVVNKETEASIGSDVTINSGTSVSSPAPDGIEVIADSTTILSNEVTATAGGAKDNNDSNTKTMQDNGGENGNGDKVNVAGAAAITIVNDRVDSYVKPQTAVDIGGDLTVTASGNDTVTSTADGSMVDGTDADVGVGVAVALNVVNLETDASASDISAANINITADSTSNITGNASAGAGGKEVGVAGSVAVNTIDQITTAHSDSTLELNGKLKISADATLVANADASPKSGSTSEEVGVGASFALNDIIAQTTATDKNTAISGNVNSLIVKAKSTITSTTITEAGTEATGNSGVAISPSVAVNVVQADTKAEHSATLTPSVGTGGVTVSSESIVNATTKAGASADGNVAIGASIGVAVIKAKNDAVVGSSLVSSGSVDVKAINKIESTVKVEATPRIGDESTDEKSDDEANKQLKTTRLSAADQKSSNADSTISQQNSAAESQGGSSSGGVGVSAAIGVNVVNTDNTAVIVDGADIDADGDVSIQATEDIDVITQAVAASFDDSNSGSAQIGAGVGLNVVNKTNRAMVCGSADIAGSNVTISAESLNSNKSAILAVAAAAGSDGAAVSVTAGVNVVNSTTLAELDGQATVESDGNTVISAKNETNIHTLVLAGGVSENSAGVGAAVSVNVLNSDVYATIDGDITSSSDISAKAINDLKPEEHTFTVFEKEVMGVKNQEVKLGDVTTVAAAGAASSGSAGVAGSFIVNAFTLDTIASVNKGAVLKADNDVSISADSESVINNVAGTIGVSGGSAGVGVGCDVTILNKNTSAIVDNRSSGVSADLSAGGSLTIAAESIEKQTSVVVGVAAADSAAVGVTASILVVTTETDAGTGYTQETGNAVKISVGDTSISASDEMKATQVVAGISASGSAAVGGAAAVLVHNDTVDAQIGDNSSLSSSGFVKVNADSSEEIVQIGALVAASGGASVAATAVVANLDENTNASIGDNATVLAEDDISVVASDMTGHISVLGNVAAGQAGVGAGGSVITVHKDTISEIGEDATLLSKSANIIVSAESREREITITAGISAGAAGIGLNASVNYLNVDTRAIIGNGADVLAEGSVLVDALDDIDLDKVTATGAAGTAGIGLAAGVTVIEQDTEALIAGDDTRGATVSGKGNSTGIDVNYGRFGTLKSESGAKNATDEENLSAIGVGEYIKTDKKSDSGIKSSADMDGLYNKLSENAEVDPVTVRKDSGSDISDEDHNGATGIITENSAEKAGFKGVAVTAKNNTDITSVTAGIGAGAVGISLNAGVTVVNESAKAEVGNNAEINTVQGEGISSDQQALIGAGNNLNYTAVTASLSGGIAAVAPAANVAVAKLNTDAKVGSGTKVNAKDDITINAKATERLLGIGFGGAGGVVGVGGSVQVINVENQTEASVGSNAVVDAKGDFVINAEDVTKSITFTGGIAGGLVGIGATVGILNVNKMTSVDIYGSVSAANVEIKGANHDELFQLAVAGGFGFVGVSGAVSIMSCVSDVSINISESASITATGTISILSDSFSDIKAFTLGMGAGFVGVGGAVSYGKIAIGSHVNISGDLTADDAIDIQANSSTNLKGWTISGGAGAVAVNAAVSTWTIGGTTTTETADGDAVDSNRPDAEAQGKSTDSTEQVSQLLTKRQGSSANVAPESADGDRGDISYVTEAVENPENNKTPDTTVASPSGTNVTIANSSDITGKKDIKISANGTIIVTQITPSVSAGAVAVGGAVNILSIATDVNTSVAGVLKSDAAITIESNLEEKVTMESIGGQGGLVAVGAAVIVANDSSSVSTEIEETGTNLRATSIDGEKVTISSVRNINEFNARLLKPATGAVVVGASFITTNIDGNGAETVIGSGAQISAVEYLTITSDAREKVTSDITPVGIGLGVISGVRSEIDVENSSQVIIEDTTRLNSGTVTVNAYGDHTNWGKIDSLNVGAVNAGVLLSSVTNVSDANVNIGAAEITGMVINVSTSNNFDRTSFDMSYRPKRTTIVGNTFSGASIDAHISEVNIGMGDTQRFSSDITIRGNAKINATEPEDGTGSPAISMLAQTNIYLYEDSHAESYAAFGNLASVSSEVNVFTSSKIDFDGGEFAEIRNESGQVSLSTLSNTFVRNYAKSVTGAIVITGSRAVADTRVDVENVIDLNNLAITATDIHISSGKVLGSAQELMGEVESFISNAYISTAAEGYAYGAVGVPFVDSTNDSDVENSIIITGNTIVKSYGNVVLEADTGLMQFSGNVVVELGSVGWVIPIPNFDDSFESLPSNTIITISDPARVVAGIDGEQTILFLNKDQADKVGLGDMLDTVELTEVEVQSINSKLTELGLETLGESVKTSAIRLTCEVEIPAYVGMVVNKGINYYKYLGIDLSVLNYDNGDWTRMPDEFSTLYYYYDADTLSDRISLQRGDYVMKDKIMYRYEKAIDLKNEIYTDTNYWSTTVSDSEKATAISSTIGASISGALKENIIVLKPTEMAAPTLSYVDYENLLRRRLDELNRWRGEHSFDATSFARYEATKEMLYNQLAELPAKEITYVEGGETKKAYVTASHSLLANLPDIYSSRGSVIVNLSDSASESISSIQNAMTDERLISGDGAAINIHNSTPVSLNINNITIKSNDKLAADNNSGNMVLIDGGGIYLNYQRIPKTEGTSVAGNAVNIIQDAVGNLEFEEREQVLITDIFVEGTILDEAGTVTITNRAGAINITGEIIALEQLISSKTSVNINTPGFYSIGANPKLLTKNLWTELKTSGEKLGTFGSQNSASSQDENYGERYVRTGGVVRAMGSITIIAGHINVNGTIQSGVSDLGVQITSGELGIPKVDTMVNEGGYVANAAEVSYKVNQINKSITIDDIITRSGNIVLCGDIFNTNPDGSNIKIAHGFANITLHNLTDYTLIVNKIDTSRRNSGSITLFDTKRIQNMDGDQEENAIKTIYRHDAGVITRENYVIEKNEAENLYTFVANGTDTIDKSHATYSPLENMFLIWAEGQAMQNNILERYEKNSFNVLPSWFSNFGIDVDGVNDWFEANDFKKVSTTEVKDETPTEIAKSQTLFYLQSGDKDYDYLKSKGMINDSGEVIYNYYGTYEETAGKPSTSVDPLEHHGGGWMQSEQWVTTVRTVTAVTDYYSHYLYASNAINIDFRGGHNESTIEIVSDGDVVLQGNIIAPENSTMTVTSDGEVKIADNVVLSGLTPEIQSANRNITMNVVISGEPLNVNAEGNITINAVAADDSTDPLIIGQIISSSGTVTINSATGVIAENGDSLVKGEKVFIKAENGTIGEETLALRVDSNILDENTGGIAALASSDIFLTEIEGDMRLIKQPSTWSDSSASIQSTTSNVSLATVDGSIINGFTSPQTTAHLRGDTVVLTTGGSGEVRDIIVGEHGSFYVNTLSSVMLSSIGDLNIGVISSGDRVTLASGGNIFDLGTAASAVLAANGLTISSSMAVRGFTDTDPFNVQLGTNAELVISAELNSWVNQVADDGSLMDGTSVVTDGLSVASGFSAQDLRLSTEEGDLRIGLVRTEGDATFEAVGNIVELTTADTHTVANVDTTGAAAEKGNVSLIAGGAIGEHDEFFDVKISGKLTSESGDNSYICGIDSLTVKSSVSTSGDIVLGVYGNTTVENIVAANGTAAIDTNGSILNGRTDNGDAISASTIVLNSEGGTIGTSTKAFAVDSTNGTVTAEATLEVFIVEHQGIMNINSIVSETSEAVVSADDGMVDANSSFVLGLEHFGLEDFRFTAPVTDLNVAATTIHLISSEGGIGTLADAIEVDVYGERTGRLNANAKDDISIDEIVGSMNTGIIVSSDGDVKIGTPDTSGTGEDIYLDESSLVKALNGNIHVRAGDNLYHLSGAMIIAGNTIFIYGDFGNSDSGVGSELVIKGSISAVLTKISGNDDNDTILLYVRDSNIVNGRVEAYGGKGDDTITALKLDTEQIHLHGEDDNDTIDAKEMTNRVHIYGGTGNDTISGGHASDVIFGGGDNDSIDAGNGTDLVFGDGGELVNDGETVASEGTGSGKDNIKGSSGADVIIGDNGTVNVAGFYSSNNLMDALVAIDNTNLAAGDNDVITGDAGNDVILGGSGADSINSGEDNDIVLGDNGTVSFEAVETINNIRSVSSIDQTTGGNDTIYGDTGDSIVIGGAGSDVITADDGNDILLGDNGSITFETVDGINNMSIISSAAQTAGGNDTIGSFAGDDIIMGGSGADNIKGGEDNDIILGDTGTVSFQTVNGVNHVRSISNENQEISGDDTIDGGTGDEFILGGAGADAIIGGDGRETILGDTGTVSFEIVDGTNHVRTISNTDQTIGGADTIYGGAGEDCISGGAGADILEGNEDNDSIFGDTVKISFVTVNGFNQVISVDARNQSVEGDDTIVGGTGSELIIAGDGRDSVDAGSSDNNDIILGDTGIINYEIVQDRSVVQSIVTNGEVNGADDVIYAGAGSDAVIGGEAGDEIYTGDGNNIVIGDNGEVVYDNIDLESHYVNHVTAVDINIGGDDTIQTGSADDIILGGMGADTIHSGTGNDIVVGDNGTIQFETGLLDIIYTADDDKGGNDTIVAGNDDKIILGGFADDTISSLNGNDIVFGDGGYVDFNSGMLIEANSDGVNFGGDDRIDTGVGLNNVIGGLGNDVIITGIDHTIDTADIRDTFSNENDVVIGDNGRRTFNKIGEQVDNHDSATLSFNFQGAASQGISSTQVAGAPESKAGQWINILSNGPGTYGNNPGEIIRTDYGQRLAGLNLTWGGKEKHRTDSIELHNYLMENYNPYTIRDPDTNQLIPGDGHLFAGGVRTSAPNTQCNNKLEIEMDGLNKYFREYSVIVYIDAPANVSSFIQNPSDSPLGSIYGIGESIRKVNVKSANYDDSFFIDDAADCNNSNYNTFKGKYIKAFAKDALSAFGKYANYAVFEGLTDDRFVITITDGVINVNFNGRDLPSIAGIQIIGEFHPIDNIETSVTEAGGDDIISTSGGNDIVLGGVGSDTIATFGDIRYGSDDADTVIGDNGSAAVTYRSGWLTENENGNWVDTVLSPEVVNAQTVNEYPEIMIPEIQFDDLIFTGNGNDVVLGGDGHDRINTQRHDDITSDIWGTDESKAPEVMKQVNLSALQNFETEGIKVLSLNFSYADSDPTRNAELKVANGEYAGVVAAKNWNNVDLRDELNPVQYPNPYYNTQFFLNDGSLASGLNLNFMAREDWGGLTSLQADRSNGHDQISPDSENSKLFESYYWAQKQQRIEININNIGAQTGFEVYDVYVYIDGDNERTDDDNFIYEISGGDRYGARSSFYLNDWKGNTFNGEFKQVTATSYSIINQGIVPNMEMVGNYVVFRNVTADNFAIRIKNVKVGDQYPLNMPCISGVQIVAGDMKDNITTNGDFDKDVVIGDHGKVNYTIDVPYGTNDNPAVARNKVFEAISNDGIKNGMSADTQSDYIVTGRNQDLVIAGNGSDAVDSGVGSDVVIADNGQVEMVDYNPIGVRQPLHLRILDLTDYDNDPYVGKNGSSADQFINKINSGNVAGVKITSSTSGGDDIVDAGADDDLVYGMEGNDVLIGNEEADVIYDPSGVNKIKNSAYNSQAAYEADVADVVPTLNSLENEALDEFISNDFNKTDNIGVLLNSDDSGDAGDAGDEGDATMIDVSDGLDHQITLAAGESVVLTATNWPGKDNPWWNPNIALIFNSAGPVIPMLDVSWDVSGVTQSASVPANNWYYWLSQIPDTPNDNGVYTIVLTANTAGTFKVKLGV